MSHGSPTKQPWSRPALYLAAFRGQEATEGDTENRKLGGGEELDVTESNARNKKKTGKSES